MTELAFWYDFSCPYAYLASTQVERVARETGARIAYEPFLLGGVFAAIGAPQNLAATMSPARVAMNARDLDRWAEVWGVPLRFPATHPNRTVTALRAAIASGDLPRATRALFDAYWRDGRDLSDPAVVADALDGAGLDGAALVKRADDPAIKDDLRRRTERAASLGVFGAPTFFVDGVMYWGQDRLEQVARALGGSPPPPPRAAGPAARPFEFWFDFSSPFAYLGATQVDALARRAGAKVTWRPFLLGALFKNIGTAEVPLSTFSAPKQAYYGRELDRFAAAYGVPFRFPTRFPMTSVSALRVAIAAGDRLPEVALRIFRAYWAEDRDISDRAVLAACCADVGLDPALVDRTQDPEVKDALRRATEEAAAKGLCGAPSYVVDGHVFWGQDRMGFVERAIAGWKPRAG